MGEPEQVDELPIPPLPDLLAMRAQADELAATPSAPVEVNDDPLQRPGVDEHLQRAEVGGPRSGQDVRLALSVAILEALLEVARRSSTARAVVFGAGFRLTTYRLRGHVYQSMTILGRKPVPEVVALIGSQEVPGEDDIFQEPQVAPAGFNPGEKIGERVLGGPGKDLRLFLSVTLLEHTLDRARASRTRRAVIHGAGLVLDTYRTPLGTVYQIVTVAGRKPIPEDPAIVGA